MTTVRSGSIGYRQSRFALPHEYQTRLLRMLRTQGFERSAMQLGCSPLTAQNLGSGGFTTRATVDRLTATLDRLAADRVLGIERTG